MERKFIASVPFCGSVFAVKVNVPKRFTGALSLPVLNQIACAVTPPQTKTLLQGVDGTVQPGEMGESGWLFVPPISYLYTWRGARRSRQAL